VKTIEFDRPSYSRRKLRVSFDSSFTNIFSFTHIFSMRRPDEKGLATSTGGKKLDPQLTHYRNGILPIEF